MRGTKAILLGAVALAGCGDIIGLGDYTTNLDASLDVVVTPDGGGDAKPEAAPDAKPDSPTEAGPSCGSSSVCVPALPGGWAWAVYDPDARVACAAGYGTSTDVEEGIDAGAAVCGCTCSKTDPSCATGNLTITSGNNNTCDNATSQNETAAGGCQTLSNQFSTGGTAKVGATGPAPSGGSCTGVPSQTLPPVGYDHQGRTCAFAGDAGSAGCTAGNVCMPDPTPFGVCVSQAGVNACPSGFPTQHLVGTNVSDTRGCTPCGCTFDAGTCTGTVTLYRGSNCSFGPAAVTADGTCTSVGNHTWVSYQYAPTTSASCAGSAVSPDGGVAFADVTTICCK